MQENTRQRLIDLAEKESWSAEDHDELLQTLFHTVNAANKFRDFLAKLEADTPAPKGAAALKIGIGRYMVCRFREALDVLAGATDNKDRHVFQGLCWLHLRNYAEAAEEYEQAKAHDADAGTMDLRIAEAQALGGDLNSAAKIVGRLEKRLSDVAMFHYVRGLVRELQGFGAEAADAYEQARTLDPACAEATFRLAYYLDLHGAEDEAIELYRECVAHPPVRANALLNLAVLYDDAGHYDDAIAMAKRVLAINPTHPRARMILKDAEASKVMYYDEEQARRLAHHNAILDTPVTDFELSVRARNCLKKMDIRTLGDLVMTTEATLMSYKNFGETSLHEIKEMLAAKGLSLGQAAEQEPLAGGRDLLAMLTGGDADDAPEAVGGSDVPVAQVEFSVRVRRALDEMGIQTLADLAAKTEADLLACSNFGQTSLNEVYAKLSEHGLQLAEGR